MLLCGAGAITIASPAPAAGIDEDFSKGLDQWWTEGGEKVWIEDGRLHVRADPKERSPGYVATVWRRGVQPADYELSLDAHVVSSSTDANNINLFLNYSDPSGAPLETTRETRRTADYPLYHKLNGYIITFLNDAEAAGGRADGSTKARVRIRRNPGFNLLAETFTYHCRRGVTYKLAVSKRGGDIRFSVDGKELLTARDPEPWAGGWFGLRTFRTWLWWDDIRLRPAS